MGNVRITANIHTPWGFSQDVTPYGEGITFYGTASHGGFKVEEPYLSRIPVEWRRATFQQQGLRGWFEEDADWSIVVLMYGDRFNAEDRARAVEIFDGWIKPHLGKQEERT